jgi:hypothetical protein
VVPAEISPSLHQERVMKNIQRFVLVAIVLGGVLVSSARADEITDWNAIMFQAALVPPATSPPNMSRNAAIVQAAVFDAVNGIERKFTAIHVEPAAQPGASRRAAAVQAAYATLVKLYPGQLAMLNERRDASLAAIASGAAAEHNVSIARGIAWGQQVADGIWAWRSTDHFSDVLPPLPDGVLPGQWRRTPPAFAAASGRTLAIMTPWAMPAPSSFRPLGPPSLASAQYAADFAEVKDKGQDTSATRTADETLYSLFWNSTTASYFWNHTALSLAADLTFSEKARLLGLLNVAMADAIIGCWEAKYTFLFWRPITAIRADGIPADATWNALFPTPAHPDYPSGHSCISGAAGRVLSMLYGEFSSFSVVSDVPAMAGVVRSFTSFSDANTEVRNARVFAGIHFRTATDDGQALGVNVADFVLEHSMLPLHGNKTGQLQH